MNSGTPFSGCFQIGCVNLLVCTRAFFTHNWRVLINSARHRYRTRQQQQQQENLLSRTETRFNDLLLIDAPNRDLHPLFFWSGEEKILSLFSRNRWPRDKTRGAGKKKSSPLAGATLRPLEVVSPPCDPPSGDKWRVFIPSERRATLQTTHVQGNSPEAFG